VSTIEWWPSLRKRAVRTRGLVLEGKHHSGSPAHNFPPWPPSMIRPRTTIKPGSGWVKKNFGTVVPSNKGPALQFSPGQPGSRIQALKSSEMRLPSLGKCNKYYFWSAFALVITIKAVIGLTHVPRPALCVCQIHDYWCCSPASADHVFHKVGLRPD